MLDNRHMLCSALQGMAYTVKMELKSLAYSQPFSSWCKYFFSFTNHPSQSINYHRHPPLTHNLTTLPNHPNHAPRLYTLAPTSC